MIPPPYPPEFEPPEEPKVPSSPTQAHHIFLSSLHWSGLITVIAGSGVWCWSDYTLDPAVKELAFAPLLAAGIFWCAEIATSFLSSQWNRNLAYVPLLALIAWAFTVGHIPFYLAWYKSKSDFESAAQQLYEHPELAPTFQASLGQWAIQYVQVEPSTHSLYFEVEGEKIDRPVFARVFEEHSANWGSYQKCAPIENFWYRCVWRY